MNEKNISTCIKSFLKKLQGEGCLEDKWQTEFPLKLSESSLDRSVPSAKADFYIPIKNKTRVFLEIERSAGSIDVNVSKYWVWLANNWYEVHNKKIILIHLLNPEQFKGQNYLSRIVIAKFIADKIKTDGYNFEYILIDNLPERNWQAVGVEKIKDILENLL